MKPDLRISLLTSLYARTIHCSELIHSHPRHLLGAQILTKTGNKNMTNNQTQLLISKAIGRTIFRAGYPIVAFYESEHSTKALPVYVAVARVHQALAA